MVRWLVGWLLACLLPSFFSSPSSSSSSSSSFVPVFSQRLNTMPRDAAGKFKKSVGSNNKNQRTHGTTPRLIYNDEDAGLLVLSECCGGERGEGGGARYLIIFFRKTLSLSSAAFDFFER
jgi:hypothetical protein